MDQQFELRYWDLARCAWCAKFYVPSYAGAVEQLQGSGHPIVIEFQNSDDDYADPYRPTQAKIEIKVGENWKFTDLFDSNIMSCWVEIYQGLDDDATLFFQGWVDPSQYEEPYDVAPYYLTIVVVDGLKYLQDIMFAESENSDGTFDYYEDRRTESQIIWDILSKIGVTQYEEYVNLFAVQMAMGPAYSPFSQTLLERDRFYDMTCAEVLTEMLRKLGAVIRQSFGVFQIFRPVELYRSVVYGRLWTSATSNTPISATPIQYIHRTATHQESALHQIPGGMQMLVAPAKRVNIKQEYGNRNSWVDNYTLHRDTYDPVTRRFEKWSAVTSQYAPIPVADILPREDEGVALRYLTNIQQTFGQYASMTPDTELFKIEFEYGFYNKATAFKDDVVASFVIIQTASDIPLWAQGKYLLKNSTEATELTWVPLDYSGSANYSNTVPMDDVGHGWTGWQTASFTFKGLPYTRPLSIRFINRYSDSIYVCIKNVRFVASATEISKITYQRGLFERLRARITSEGFRIWLAKKYILKDKYSEVDVVTENLYNPICDVVHGDVREYDFILGDIVKESTPPIKGDTGITNNLEQFAGSLAILAPETVEAAIQTFISAFASYYAAVDVLLSYEENSAGIGMLVFKAAVPGVDFGAAASISSITGDIVAQAYTIQANQAGTRQLVELLIEGTGGYVTITIAGVTRNMNYYGSSIDETITHFIDLYDYVYAAVGITLDINSTNDALLMLGDAEGNSFTYNAIDTGLIPTEVLFVAASPIGQRTDAIEITGTTGSAAITCAGVTKTFSFGFALVTPSSEWCAGDDSSDAFPYKPLVQIIGDEIAAQYSRSKYLIQMPIIERVTGVKSGLKINGCIIDTENEVDGVPRKFVVNRGSFDTRHRKWELDLVELLPYEGVQPEIEPDSIPSYESDEEPYYIPGNEGNIPSSEDPEPSGDYAIQMNHIDTIADGQYGKSMYITYEYTAEVARTENIKYYFSSDAAGELAVSVVEKVAVAFSLGTHTAQLIGVAYPVSTAKYLHIYLEAATHEKITSNQFDSVLVLINYLDDIYGLQAAGENITPDPTFSCTISGGSISLPIYWTIRNSSSIIIASGQQTFAFSTGTSDETLTSVLCPMGEYEDCILTVGFTEGSAVASSNGFTIAFI